MSNVKPLRYVRNAGDTVGLSELQAGETIDGNLIDNTALTEIGTALADDDEIPVYDASAVGNRKSLLSRIWTYISGKLASPPAIGGTTPAAGNFTTLGATGNVTLGDASGDTVAIQAGTSSLPSLIPNGDPNTGMWFPAADTVAWSTSGSERLRITNAGQVGIGAAPISRLSVSADMAGLGSQQFNVTGSNTNKRFRIGFDTTNDYGVLDALEAGVGYKNLVFNPVAGNVGIGATLFGTSASLALGLKTGTAPSTGPADTIQIYSTDLSAGNTILSLFTEGTPVNANTTADATHRIAIRVNGTVYYLLANTAA